MNPNDPSAAPSVVTTLIRSALMAAGASYVTQGVITASQESDIVGGLLAAGAVAWSIVQKLIANRKLKAAIAAPAGLAKPPAA